VDLVAIVTGASVDAAAQRVALVSELSRRGITMPTAFTVSDVGIWETGYAAEARRSLLPTSGTLDEALRVVGPFLDPLFGGTASGGSDPTQHLWVPSH
jgi:hypothetical protein